VDLSGTKLSEGEELRDDAPAAAPGWLEP
jgi:hypothetical protein